MKTKADPRHQKRIEMMKYLFGYSFNNPSLKTPDKYQSFQKHKDHIDRLIKQCAPEWPLNQINRIDLAILRLAIYELVTTETPHKVDIDEAVELAKEYGSENSSKFVNGVLGSALQKITQSNTATPSTNHVS